MEAQELRISNYFEYRIQDKLDERKDWWEVSQIDVNDLVILDSNIDYDYRPIPLTEEWLVKFGFEHTKTPYVRRPPNCKLFILAGIILVRSKIKDSQNIYWHNWTDTKIQYVHQLQNLYFALTGEELTIKS